MRHNNIGDFEANLLHKVYNDVETEPSLKPLNGEHINGLTGNESRSDISARGVWRNGQNAFFDIRITNPNSNSQIHQPIENILKRHETEKKRQYNSRVMNIEHGTFTWVGISAGGWKNLENLISGGGGGGGGAYLVLESTSITIMMNASE